MDDKDFEKYINILSEICGCDPAYLYNSDTIDTMLKAMQKVEKLITKS